MLCERPESRPRSHIAWPNIILSSSLEIQLCDYLTKKIYFYSMRKNLRVIILREKPKE